MKRLNLRGINLFIQIESMRKLLFSLVIVCNAFLVHAQWPESQWPEFNLAHPVSCQWPSYNYNPHGYFENVFIIDTTPSFFNGFLMFGKGSLCHPDSCSFYTRCFAAKCNTNGDLNWWRRYDNPQVDEGQEWFDYPLGNFGGMVKNHDGKIVSTFETYTDNNQKKNFLVSIDSEGEILSQRLFDTTFAGFNASGIIEDFSDSTYIVYGAHQDSLDVLNFADPNSFLLKLDSLGNTIWFKTYSNTYSAYSVFKALDGGFWLCASTIPIGECSGGWFLNTDFILIKTDEEGNEESRIVIGGQCGGERAEIYEYEEDKVILFGRNTTEVQALSTFSGFFYTAHLEQYSNNQLSIMTDVKKYLSSYLGAFADYVALNDGTFLISGDNSISSNWTGWNGDYVRLNGFILKLTQQRDSLWCRSYSFYNNTPNMPEVFGFAKHHILDTKPTPDGGFVCCGFIEQETQDPNPFLKTPWIFKVDSMGCVEPGCQYVNVEEIVVGLENTITVFPNPATDVVNLSFTFPENYVPSNQNEIVIIDMQGREVLRENIFLFASSSNTIEINISSLSSGMYTLHWISNSAWLDSSKVIVE